MFQGSENLGKMRVHVKLVKANGGILNGSTRFDFTNYFEVVPSNALETALWARGRPHARRSTITQDNLKNQQDVVNERGPGQRAQPAVRRLPVARPAAVREHELVQRAQLLRRPEATSTPRRSTTCRSSSRPTTRRTTRSLVVVGDFEPGAGEGVGREVLRRHPVARAAAAARHLRAAAGRRRSAPRKDDKLATRPALAIGVPRCPARNTPEYYAMGLLDQMLRPGQGQPRSTRRSCRSAD